MARESQGLQVLLIVFVMLSVVLGVSLYLYVKKADETAKAEVAAVGREKEAKEATAKMQQERDVLKTLIGFPERTTEDIRKQFAEDMATYGNEKSDTDKPLFDQSTLAYSRLLASMNKVILDRTDELIRSRELAVDMDKKFKNREAGKDDQIKAFSTGVDELRKVVTGVTNDISEKMKTTQDESQRMNDEVQRIKKDATAATTQAADLEKKATQAVKEKEDEVRRMAIVLNKDKKQDMDVPSGEITWVSLPNNTVWINRGRADALQRQTKFTVYSSDSTDTAKAVKKGTVEVTKIEGDHSAQCRIVEDKIADPIMAGDKVFTPFWSPGQQNHFALTGIMNLDGDGRNQLNVVRGLINQNSGTVDCWLDEQGHKQGQITVNTRYIVVGDAPDKSSQDFIKNHGDILRDAERYHIPIMKLGDFKQQMGYQKTSSVEHFGSGTTSGDVGRAATAAKAGKAAKAPAKSEEAKGEDAEK